MNKLIFLCYILIVTPLQFIAQEHFSQNTQQVTTPDDICLDPDVKAKAASGWMNIVKKNIRYPDEAKKANVSGQILVNFIVEANGTINNIHVDTLEGLNNNGYNSLAMEAARIVALLPKFTPAYKNGVAVKTKHKLPINFTISK